MKKQNKNYEPEIGQAVFGNPTGDYYFPEFAEAFLMYIFEEIRRVFWNKNQREWENYEDPKIEGIKVRPYCWGEDEEEAEKPNFEFNGVAIRWYKYPGRGMSCNKAMNPEQWKKWFDECLGVIRKSEPKLF